MDILKILQLGIDYLSDYFMALVLILMHPKIHFQPILETQSTANIAVANPFPEYRGTKRDPKIFGFMAKGEMSMKKPKTRKKLDRTHLPSEIETVRCNSAEMLLAELDPNGKNSEVWSELNAWVFRGQSDSAWSLLPSALRPTVQLLHFGKWQRISSLKRQIEFEQIRAEFETVRRFYVYADAIGLPIPEDSAIFRSLMAVYSSAMSFSHYVGMEKDAIEWPPDQLLPLLGIAQHHGMPTRLIDWTRNPFIACYFAAAGAAERLAKVKEDGRLQAGHANLVVFAYSRYHSMHQELQEAAGGSGRAMRFITVPSAGNKNLGAQQGLFSVFQRREIPLVAPIDRRPFEELLGPPDPRGFSRISTKGASKPFTAGFLRFVLPIAEAPRLLRLVARLSVSGSSLFPGFDGVWRAMNETQLWDELYTIHPEEVRQPRGGDAY